MAAGMSRDGKYSFYPTIKFMHMQYASQFVEVVKRTKVTYFHQYDILSMLLYSITLSNIFMHFLSLSVVLIADRDMPWKILK